ncbi:MAG: energy transducer TonB [Terriglobales bacterium]
MGDVSFGGWQRILVLSLLSTFVIMPRFAPTLRAQQESIPAEGSRKILKKVVPEYPELARRMKIAGSVKVQLTIAPNGTVKDTKIIGGHPLLANAVIDAVPRWRFETLAQSTTETLEFRFEPVQ